MRKDIERYSNETYLRGDAPCMDCESKDNLVWSTHNVFWNDVMKGVKGSGILCIYCFARRAQKKFKVRWFLLPEFDWSKQQKDV